MGFEMICLWLFFLTASLLFMGTGEWGILLGHL